MSEEATTTTTTIVADDDVVVGDEYMLSCGLEYLSAEKIIHLTLNYRRVCHARLRATPTLSLFSSESTILIQMNGRI